MRTGSTLLHGGALALAIVVVCPSRGTTQAAPTVQPGTRVRLTWTPDPQSDRTTRTVGTLMRLGPDSIAVYDEKRLGVVAAAFGALRRLETSRGRRSHAGRGALIGLAAGAGAGVASGAIVCASGNCSSSGGEWGGVVIGVLGVGGGLAGAGIGALVGAMIRSEGWEPVPLRPADHARPEDSADVRARRAAQAGGARQVPATSTAPTSRNTTPKADRKIVSPSEVLPAPTGKLRPGLAGS